MLKKTFQFVKPISFCYYSDNLLLLFLVFFVPNAHSLFWMDFAALSSIKSWKFELIYQFLVYHNFCQFPFQGTFAIDIIGYLFNIFASILIFCPMHFWNSAVLLELNKNLVELLQLCPKKVQNKILKLSYNTLKS